MSGNRAPFSCLAAVITCDITPDVGIHLHNWSYSPHPVATGVHEPLMATILSIVDSTGVPAVIVGLDLGWWMEEADENRLRQAILERCALEPQNLIVALSHTHSGPSICRSDAAEPGGHLIASYLDHIAEAIADAALHAVNMAEPALLEWTVGSCTLATNRDLWLGAQQRYVVGTNDGGPSDDTLLVGRLTRTLGGEILAVVCNYAVHLTSLGGDNSLLSPDLLGAARREVITHTGAPLLFLQGASGDLAPRRQYSSEPLTADDNGRVLGHAIVSALFAMDPAGTELTLQGVVESGAPLAVHVLSFREPRTDSSFAVRSLALGTQPNEPALAPAHILSDRLLRAQRIGSNVGNETTDFPVAVWTLGELVIFAYPGEAYSLLQKTLRSLFPERVVLLVNLANGAHRGYLAPEPAYDDGRYPAWQSPLARGSFEALLAFCIDYLSQSDDPPIDSTAPRNLVRDQRLEVK